ILTYLTYRDVHPNPEGNRPNPVSSVTLAASIGSHPVVVRRILSLLQKSGLVKTSSGVIGGAQLNQQPDKITLLDIYLAIADKDDDLFASKKISVNPQCPVGSQFKSSFRSVISIVEDQFRYALSSVTIAHLVNTIVHGSTSSSAIFIHQNLSGTETNMKIKKEDPLPIFLY
ncbi:MAG: Rrf2 family transcriptional regulator, partial [Pyrinomonadaceae bacterium]